MTALKLILNVTRAYCLAGAGGGFVLGGALPLVLLPLLVINVLSGKEAEFGTLLLVVVVGAATGTVVGLAVGLLVGVLSSVLTLLFLRERTGTQAHLTLLRVLSVTTAAVLMFFGVGLLTGSMDMSAPTVLIWRMPAALVAAGYGWWLAGRMARNASLWNPAADTGDAVWGKPWEYEQR